MQTKSFLRGLDESTHVRAALDGGFKKCCMKSGVYMTAAAVTISFRDRSCESCRAAKQVV
jgi:hypothetical protein